MKFFFHSIRKQFTLFNFNFSFNYKLNSIDQFFKIRLNIKNFKKKFKENPFWQTMEDMSLFLHYNNNSSNRGLAST
jgi:hypothetical protein